VTGRGEYGGVLLEQHLAEIEASSSLGCLAAFEKAATALGWICTAGALRFFMPDTDHVPGLLAFLTCKTAPLEEVAELTARLPCNSECVDAGASPLERLRIYCSGDVGRRELVF